MLLYMTTIPSAFDMVLVKVANTYIREGPPGHILNLLEIIMLYQQLQRITLTNKAQAANQIRRTLPALVVSAIPTADGLLLRTAPSKLRALALFLRNSTYLQLRTLVDIAVVDKLLPEGRFAVNYLLLSMTTNQRVTIQLFANETTTIASLAVPFANGQRLFAAAGWLEREV